MEGDGVVCMQYAGYFEFTTSVEGDITSDSITFRQCGSDVIQAADISEDWQPTYTEFVSLAQLPEIILIDSNANIALFITPKTEDIRALVVEHALTDKALDIITGDKSWIQLY